MIFLKKANNRYDVSVKNAIRNRSNSSVVQRGDETALSSISFTAVEPHLAPRLKGRVQ